MDIDLTTFLTCSERTLCEDVAKVRLDQKRDDMKMGDSRASYSFGSKGSGKERTYNQELNDSLMGTLGELIASKVTRTEWTQELGQYKGNSKPDLSILFDGKRIKGECRATRRKDSIIYRSKDRTMNAGKALIAITNLPNGPLCQVVFASFGFLGKLVDKHPEWIGSHSGHPYYNIPIEYFTDDFSRFG